jgi:predicted nucleic acid-binding protein
MVEADEDLAITGLILAEVLQGLRQDSRLAGVQSALLGCRRLEPAYPETYLSAAGAFRACRQKGLTIRSVVDCVIAVVAVEAGATLLAKDRDFKSLERVMGLKLVQVA